jgi:hypothetical protein
MDKTGSTFQNEPLLRSIELFIILDMNLYIFFLKENINPLSPPEESRD